MESLNCSGATLPRALPFHSTLLHSTSLPPLPLPLSCLLNEFCAFSYFSWRFSFVSRSPAAAFFRMEKLFDCITRDFRLSINSVLEPRQAKTSQVALSFLATIKWTRLADSAAAAASGGGGGAAAEREKKNTRR